MSKNILILPGDGIGPEIVTEAVKVLAALRDGFGLDIVTRLGGAFRYPELEIEEKEYGGVSVRVVTPRTLWLLKRDTARPIDRFDAEQLRERFGLEED